MSGTDGKNPWLADLSQEFLIPGELFLPRLWPGAQTVVRYWHFVLSPKGSKSERVAHKVCLRHGQVTGNWVLIVDGAVTEVGFEPIVHRTFTIPFRISEQNAKIQCEGATTLGYAHSLQINGMYYKDFRDKDTINIGERIPMYVSIPDTRTYSEEEKQITVYQIYAKSGTYGQSIIERRYSDFAMLNKLIRAQVDGHLLQDVPKLPVKVINPFVDQSNDAFINSRREALETFLQEILMHPVLSMYTDFLCFVGVHPVSGDPIHPPLYRTLMDCDVPMSEPTRYTFAVDLRKEFMASIDEDLDGEDMREETQGSVMATSSKHVQRTSLSLPNSSEPKGAHKSSLKDDKKGTTGAAVDSSENRVQFADVESSSSSYQGKKTVAVEKADYENQAPVTFENYGYDNDHFEYSEEVDEETVKSASGSAEDASLFMRDVPELLGDTSKGQKGHVRSRNSSNGVESMSGKFNQLYRALTGSNGNDAP